MRYLIMINLIINQRLIKYDIHYNINFRYMLFIIASKNIIKFYLLVKYSIITKYLKLNITKMN